MNVNGYVKKGAMFAALLVLAATVSGCAGPPAAIKLLNAADSGLTQAIEAHGELSRTLLAQADLQRERLNAAFAADINRLATSEGMVKLSDVEEAKQFYDKKRVELDAADRELRAACERQKRTLEAIRDLIDRTETLLMGWQQLGQEAEWYKTRLKELFEKSPPLGSLTSGGAEIGGGE